MEEEPEEFIEEYGITHTAENESQTICVGVFQGSAKDRVLCDDYLDELEQLADTFGVTVKKKIAFSLRNFDSAYFLTKGKREELQQLCLDEKIDLVILDEEISPAQQRNLEKFLKVAVMDRTELILEIFAQRAKSKEAKLQIELAKIQYEFPRLKRLWSHFSRQRFSGGFLKGEGEKQLEIDRRLLQKKIDRLKKQLKEVVQVRSLQTQQRRESRTATFAIIGYTNAGKSTLLNALTNAGVFVEDKLFATLDPTTRKFSLPDHEEILLTDTVGFIRKLPHHLVEAFKSTLESALSDDVLLHIVDASHPMAKEHIETTLRILREMGADKKPRITILNKCDLVKDPISLNYLRFMVPKTVTLSAITREGFDLLYQALKEELAAGCVKTKLRIPQKDYDIVTKVYSLGNHVHYEEYEENDVILLVDLAREQVSLFEKYRVEL